MLRWYMAVAAARGLGLGLLDMDMDMDMDFANLYDLESGRRIRAPHTGVAATAAANDYSRQGKFLA